MRDACGGVAQQAEEESSRGKILGIKQDKPARVYFDREICLIIATFRLPKV